MTTITIDSNAVQQQLARLQGNATNLHAAFDAIGQMIRSNVLDCFEHEQSPDGINWKALSPATKLARAKRVAGGHKIKSGKRTTKAFDRAYNNMKILNDRGKLKGSIAFRASNTFAEVTTDTEYAAVHQFGSPSKGIAARPFFPNQTLPQNWEQDILQMLESHLNH